MATLCHRHACGRSLKKFLLFTQVRYFRDFPDEIEHFLEPKLSDAEVNKRLSGQEFSCFLSSKKLGFTVNQVGVNRPVEDRWSAYTFGESVEADHSSGNALVRVQEQNPKETVTIGGNIFSVIDGHSGHTCAHAINLLHSDYLVAGLLPINVAECVLARLRPGDGIGFSHDDQFAGLRPGAELAESFWTHPNAQVTMESEDYRLGHPTICSNEGSGPTVTLGKDEEDIGSRRERGHAAVWGPWGPWGNLSRIVREYHMRHLRAFLEERIAFEDYEDEADSLQLTKNGDIIDPEGHLIAHFPLSSLNSSSNFSSSASIGSLSSASSSSLVFDKTNSLLGDSMSRHLNFTPRTTGLDSSLHPPHHQHPYSHASLPLPSGPSVPGTPASLTSTLSSNITPGLARVMGVVSAIRRSLLRLDLDTTTAALPSLGLGLNKALLRIIMSGCVATSVYLPSFGHEVYISQVGDCGAVLGSYIGSTELNFSESFDEDQWSTELLVAPHNTHNELEVSRLKARHPLHESDFLLRDDRLLGELMPLRAFGDIRYKWSVDHLKHVARLLDLPPNYPVHPAFYTTPPYLVATPQILYRQLQPGRDACLILATDGLWDMVSPREAVTVVARHWHDYHGRPANCGPGDTAASRLIRTALGGGEMDSNRIATLLSVPANIARYYRDDITVIVIYPPSAFDPPLSPLT